MKKIYTIGRGEECDIVIPDNTDVISRLHATIRVESNDKIYLVDQSRNGTYVNGMKMSSNVEIPVSRKDVVSFAHIYNLDWATIPLRKSNKLRTILITLACIIVTTGVAYAMIAYWSGSETVASTETVEAENPSNVDVVASDTIVQRDTAVVTKDSAKVKKPKKRKKNKKTEERKDTVIEIPVVIDPIY